MNKVYRVIWNEARGCYVVAHEKASARGKPSHRCQVVAQAVAGALLALGGAEALANVCGNPPLTTISTAVNDQCALANGESVEVVLPGGTISGVGTAILVDTGITAGSITNQGLLQVEESGIVMRSASLTGGITNSGTIFVDDDDSTGIYINNSYIAGGITNSGTIIAGSSSDGSGINITNGSSVAGGIINSGTIEAPTSTGINLNGSTLSGGIINSGLISAEDSGIEIESNATLSGGIINSGTISVDDTGINLVNSLIMGGVTNSGTILAGTWDDRGIDLESGTLTGDIINTGTISSPDNGSINIQTAFADPLPAPPTLLDGSIINSATGTLNGKTGIWIGDSDQGAISVTGNIVNHGTILGSWAGVAIDLGAIVDGYLTNSGTIVGPGGSTSPGVYINGASTLSGGITNSGTISGLASPGHSLVVSSDSTVPHLHIAGSQAAFVGRVTAPNTAVAVLAGANFAITDDFEVQSFTVTGTLEVPSAEIGTPPTVTVSGSYLQTGTFHTHGTASGSMSQLSVSGTAAFADAGFAVTTGGGTNCDNFPPGTTIAGVISASSITASPTFGSVTDDCPAIAFLAVANGNQVDLQSTLSAPTDLLLLPGDGQIQVAFTGVAGANSYTATCTSSDGGATGTATGGGSPLTVTGLTNGKTYTCTVRATDGTYTSPASAASSPVIPTPPTPIPTLSEWGLILLGPMLGGVAGWRMRRRKQEQAH